MPQRTLRFRIRQDGLVEETVQGVLGASCHQLTERLEEALGVVKKTEPTAEGFLRPQEQNQSISSELH